ncbi:MAG: glycosyltransferase [Leptospiraceae bacterium]|nr:glycosyltransferase [Leptospiraceae bacterium]
MRKVSIVIPFQKENDYLKETLERLKSLDYGNFEVVLLPDEEGEIQFFKNNQVPYPYKVIPTGKVSPAIKRDIGVEKGEGEIAAFIDDDAYPDTGWLKKATVHFDKEEVCAVGGPQVTPETDSFSQKVSGAMFLSFLNGNAVIRYWPIGQSKEIDDWPTVNLLVRKNNFLEVGGFDSTFYPGEDTKLCLDLINKLNKKIIYEPNAVVYHHRRSGFFRHLKQVGRYGLHRGHFAKVYPETSLRLQYMIPSLFFIFCLLGWFPLLFFPEYVYVYLGVWGLYCLVLCLSVISVFGKIKNVFVSISTLPYTLGTHIFYGLRFIQGYFTKNLRSKLGR